MFDPEYLGSIVQKSKSLHNAISQLQAELDFNLKLIGEHSRIVGNISDDGLTQDQRDILLDFCKLFLRSYPHYRKEVIVSTGLLADSSNSTCYQFGGVRIDD